MLAAVKTSVHSVVRHHVPVRPLSVNLIFVQVVISTNVRNSKALFVDVGLGHHHVENAASIFAVVITISHIFKACTLLVLSTYSPNMKLHNKIFFIT